MQFDYLSLTEANMKKWVQCIVIAICSYIIFEYELYAKHIKTNYYGVAFSIYIFIASRIVLSTV